MSLPQLSSNLQELYSAVHRDEPIPAKLVANPWGSRVYNSTKGWGRLWRWFYSFIGIVYKGNLKQRALTKAMLKTKQLFETHLTLVQENGKKYGEYLEALCKNKKHDTSKLKSVRKGLVDWVEGVRPFVKLVYAGKNKQVETLFQEYYGSCPRRPFTCDQAVLATLKNYQRVVDLEGLFHTDLPITVLAKLSTGEKLKDEEEKHLKRWIKKFNKSKENRGIREIHKTLLAFVQFLKADKKAKLTRLELALVDRECKVFLERDKKHIKWRDSLKPGDTVRCKGKTIVLGKELGEKKPSKKNKNVVFAIKGDPSKVVVVGINRAVLRLKRRLAKNHGILFHTAKYEKVDASGSLALIERLHDPIDGYAWTSIRGKPISYHDQGIAFTLAKAIKWLIEQERTPYYLSTKYLMYDRKRLLKSLKVPLEREFDYLTCEQFAFDAANKNYEVFKYLIVHSKLRPSSNDQNLISYQYAGFFKTVVRHALDGNKTKISDVASIRKITDPKIVDRGEKLYKEANEIKDRCSSEIQASYHVPNTQLLETQIAQVMKHLYDSMYQISIFWHTFQDNLINEVVKQYSYRRKG